MSAPCGILVLDKPVGMTSRGAVNCVARVLRGVKVGHAGTLDPLAEGVLVVCVGQATRLIEYLHRLLKQYRATFRLGATSPTLDLESDVCEQPAAPCPSRQEIERVLSRWTGDIEQRPPAFSALWVAGRRAYHIARQGNEPELSPRRVTVHAMKLVRYEYPEVVLDITCGTGTYIRALGRDLAADLATVAVMTDLARTAIGPFTRSEAILPHALTHELALVRLRSPLESVSMLSKVLLTSSQREALTHGGVLELDAPAGVTELAAVDEQGQLAAILAPARHGWRPALNFVAVQ